MQNFRKGPSIKYVAQICWFSDTPSPLYAFKQWNDIMKTIDVRFLPWPPSSSSERTYFMDVPKKG